MTSEHKAAGKTVAFVIATNIRGVLKYRPSMGTCYNSEGDNDSFVQITFQQPFVKSVDEARKEIEAVIHVDEKFLEPVPFDEFHDDILWYSQIESAQKEVRT